MPKIIYIICTCLLLACSNSKNHESKLTKDEMVSLLIDMHMTDATINAINSLSKYPVTVDSAQYDSIFFKHGITYKTFEWNIVYYTHKQELGKIYAEVITILNERKSALKVDDMKMIDSLNNARNLKKAHHLRRIDSIKNINLQETHDNAPKNLPLK